MKALKIRGLIGSILGIVMSLLSIFLLFLPMLVETQAGAATQDNVIYSVFDSMFKIGAVSETLGTEGTLYIISSACMIVFFALSLVMLCLSILTLVSFCLSEGKAKVSEKLNMSLSLKVLSLITAVIGTIATVLLVLYFSANDLLQTTFGYGTIVPLVVSLLNIGSAFTIPTNKEIKIAEKKIKKAVITN